MSARPNTATAYMSNQRLGDLPVLFRAAVDGMPCGCGGADGVGLFAMGANDEIAAKARNAITLCLFEHDMPGVASCRLSPEMARTLVNHLMAAIAAIEGCGGLDDDPVRRLLENER